MKAYQAQVESTAATPLAVRTLPDPSKGVIQHHLQRARLAAGPDDYVAVLYSAHGIQEPPTEAGELWCYDQAFDDCLAKGTGPSEYIPILLFDYLTWAGASSIYVWDTSYAGRFVRASFTESAEIDSQLRAAAAQNPAVARLHPAVYMQRGIHFAACSASQALPHVPHMPDDLFTACLVTPLRTAMTWHNFQTFPLTSGSTEMPRSTEYMLELFASMSKGLEKRLWDELSAVLRTIAWQTMEPATYALFLSNHGDTLSTLACGFLLAQRILGSYGAEPESKPSIPLATTHMLWTTWDLIMDNFFVQVPERLDDAKWQDTVKHVAFIGDQLDSILTDGPVIGGDPSSARNQAAALARLPIICHAAHLPVLRVKACTALDKCLQALDVDSLNKAIQCGALHTAIHFLVSDDGGELFGASVTSIWSSLIRHDACVEALLKTAADVPAEHTMDSLADLPAIAFFLQDLDGKLEDKNGDGCNPVPVVQAASVLSSIAGRRCDDTLGVRCLDLGTRMLLHPQELVQQWGALLVAQVLKHGAHLGASPRLYEQLLDRMTNGGAETRAASVYALLCFVPVNNQHGLVALGPALTMASRVVAEVDREASPLVRKQLAMLAGAVVGAAGHYSALALLIHWISRAVEQSADRNEDAKHRLRDVQQALADAGVAQCMPALVDVVAAVATLHGDSSAEVAETVYGCWTWMASLLQPHLAAGPKANEALSVSSAEPGQMRSDFLDDLCAAASSVAANDLTGVTGAASQKVPGQDLFETSILALRAYLTQEAGSTALEDENKRARTRSEQTWLQRHRMLEDAIVVAEQQERLPWEWAMKDISSPDPWSTIACHSFTNVLLATANSSDLMFWDWFSGKNLGVTRLKVPPGSYLSDNGDVHVLAKSASGTSQYEPISAFRALDMSAAPAASRNLYTSWYRSAGQLCVGGASGIVNVWDCPAERRVLAMKTGSDAYVSHLATEPRSGNLVLAGLEDGVVKLFDTRVARCEVLAWDGTGTPGLAQVTSRRVMRLGVVLGESSNVTTANANGIVSIHDLRRLSSPVSSVLAQPAGIASANFQAHSGLLTTTSPVRLGPDPSVEWALYRSFAAQLALVSREAVGFGAQADDVARRGLGPYNVFHQLRPFLAIGYGRTCILRASGKGKGADTDSGSHIFLEQQERLLKLDA
ncbi:hypothetical protein Q5752_003730 [Cryptotrichosporon argae]